MRRLIVIPLLLLLAACESQRHTPPETREAVAYVDITEPPHEEWRSLPPWAACWFPHLAWAGALRRAQPCPAEVRATRSYTRREVAGCWVIRFPDGRPFDGPPPYDRPIRLRLEPDAAMRRNGFRHDEGAVVPAGGRRLPREPGFYRFWTFSPPDSVRMVASALYVGTHLDFRVRGDSMVGMVSGYGDFIVASYDTTSARVFRVTARRIGCP